MLRLIATHSRHKLKVACARNTIIVGRYPSYLPAVAHFSAMPPLSPPDQDKPKEKKESMMTTVSEGVKGAFVSVYDTISNPKETWKTIKEVAHHYWLGSKLLWSDIKVAKEILSRVLGGHSMTRRERMQLIKTTTDIFRLVPFSIFIIVPFMELLLPFALKLFPNMLPSTFQDSLKAEESMKQELQMRLAVAKFMQETLQEMAEKKSSSSGADKDASGAKEVIEFVEKARLGEHIPKEDVMRIAKLFQDELTLSNVMRPQLVSMCQYMGLQPYGADSFLRFQIRSKLRMIQDDDRRILWEGIDSLNTIELRDACRERGMRSIGMTQFKLKKQLQEWLDLSTQKGIPIFLLIMSRAFMLNAAGAQAVSSEKASDPEQVLKSSMSFLDQDTINEVVLSAASRGEVDSSDMRRRRLESIQFQKELMDEELQEQVDAKKALNATAEASAAAAALPSASAQLPEEQVVGDRASIAAQGAGAGAVLSAPATANPPLVIKPTAQITTMAAPASSSIVQTKSGTSADTAPASDSKESGAVTEAPADKKQELSVHELLTIGDLARGNTLRREISELAVLEAFIQSLPLSHPAAAGASSSATGPSSSKSSAVSASEAELRDKHKVAADGGAAAGQAQAEDKSVLRMKSAISTMLSNLKVKINTTEKVLGDKLKVLDKDGDGQISFDEIKDVIGSVMKKGASTEESVEQLFSLLDSNKDGKVSVAELLHYIHKKRETMEVEAAEAQMRAAALAQPAAPVPPVPAAVAVPAASAASVAVPSNAGKSGSHSSTSGNGGSDSGASRT